MSDLSVRGGEYGMLVGSQQYSVSRIYIVASKKCVGLIWNWVFVSLTPARSIASCSITLPPPPNFIPLASSPPAYRLGSTPTQPLPFPC